jgi:cell division protein ZapA
MKVQISIGGRKYTLRSDEDEDLQAIARYVDRKMNEIASRGARVDDYTLALLAALNIASEFDRFRRDVDQELQGLDRDLASTAVLLESTLPEGPDPDRDDEGPGPPGVNA